MDYVRGIFRETRRWAKLHPAWTLALAVTAALVPFLAKPFNMDDPLFIWTARHIQAHPGNPYGFEVNWFGTAASMWEVTKNPPLAAYYLAVAGAVLGWSEVALHGAFLLPAVAVILGTYRLGRHFCGRPMFAAFLNLLTPVFLVSSTTVMCDVLMLAFWVWAVVFWLEGTAAESPWRHLAAGLLVALALLTKYYGACLIPLLAAHRVIARRRAGWWMASLLIPVAALGAYHWATRALYGRSLLWDAAAYATLPAGLESMLSLKLNSAFTALAFTGGGLAVAGFLAPLLWRPRVLALFGAATAALTVCLLLGGVVLKNYGPLQGTSRGFLEVQLGFWAWAGVCVLALAVADVWHRRDADAWLLGLWVAGTFLFAAGFNWTVNGRSVLPMAPAVGLLLVRRLERIAPAASKTGPRGVAISFAFGAVLALLVTRADFLFARAARESAQRTCLKYGRGPARFWFQGHWGFQYYLETLGASALDEARTRLQRGDVVAAPANNANYSAFNPELVVVREFLAVPGPGLLTTMKGEVGAGFYASMRGPLPFAFGLVPPEIVAVLALEPAEPGAGRAPAGEGSPPPADHQPR